jgi:hypothetical protein
MTIRRALLGVAVAGMASVSASPAYAVCAINALGLSVTPSSASTGTYTFPTAPTAQTISITVSGTYFSLLGGTCTGSISFHRASLPASMAITGGGSATLPYTIQTAPTGGNTLLYTGGGTPGASNRLTFAFTATVLGANTAFTQNLTAYALAIPGTLQQAGSYSDSLTLDVFNETVPGIPTKLIGPAFTMNGTVAKVCTIGGVATPAADTATIPVSSGVVNTAPINKSYANAACNTPSNLQLTSLNGAVKTSASVVSGYTNLIDYAAAATFSGANASLNTSTIATATGPESGTSSPTTGTTPSDTLLVTITPQTNALKLLAGTYQDTLRITITPQ